MSRRMFEWIFVRAAALFAFSHLDFDTLVLENQKYNLSL